MKFSTGFFQIGKGTYISYMSSQLDLTLKSLLNLEETDFLSSDGLKDCSSKYPFSSIIQLIYTKQLMESNDNNYLTQGIKTSLFFPSSPWYNYLVNSNILIENQQKVKATTSVKLEENLSVSDTVDMGVPLEPYHTIDYFASQGIKISHTDDKDDIGRKVKSFTAWLKTMKRLQPEEAPFSRKEFEADPETTAFDTLQTNTIVTEAMADVFIKQGLTEKAIDIYQKLSLQNPDNSRIFADKISALKEKRP